MPKDSSAEGAARNQRRYPPRPSDPNAPARRCPGSRRGAGLGYRHRPGECLASVQLLLHDQARRHGNGAVNLPLDHRSARGAIMGLAQHHGPRCDLSIHSLILLLVEGTSHISGVIKYLTQSTWSHAALYVGPIRGAILKGEPHVLVEAELGQ